MIALFTIIPLQVALVLAALMPLPVLATALRPKLADSKVYLAAAAVMLVIGAYCALSTLTQLLM